MRQVSFLKMREMCIWCLFRPSKSPVGLGTSDFSRSDHEHLVALRTKAIETKDDLAVGQLAGVVLMLVKEMLVEQDRMDAKAMIRGYEERETVEHLAREFETTEEGIRERVERAEADLPDWIKTARISLEARMCVLRSLLARGSILILVFLFARKRRKTGRDSLALSEDRKKELLDEGRFTEVYPGVFNEEHYKKPEEVQKYQKYLINLLCLGCVALALAPPARADLVCRNEGGDSKEAEMARMIQGGESGWILCRGGGGG